MNSNIQKVNSMFVSPDSLALVFDTSLNKYQPIAHDGKVYVPYMLNIFSDGTSRMEYVHTSPNHKYSFLTIQHRDNTPHLTRENLYTGIEHLGFDPYYLYYMDFRELAKGWGNNVPALV